MNMRAVANLLFHDGHVAWRKYRDVQPYAAFNNPPYWDPDEDGNIATP